MGSISTLCMGKRGLRSRNTKKPQSRNHFSARTAVAISLISVPIGNILWPHLRIRRFGGQYPNFRFTQCSRPDSGSCAHRLVWQLCRKTGKYKGMVMIWSIGTLIGSIIWALLSTASTATMGLVLLFAGAFPIASVNSVNQITPYTYPMTILELQDLATGLTFIDWLEP